MAFNSDELYQRLFSFEYCRKKHHLAAADNSFFKPYNNPLDLQQQLRTAAISPIIGASAFFNTLLTVIRNCSMLLVDFCTLDMADFIQTGEEGLKNVVSGLAITIVALAVTVSATLSLATRLLGTLLPLEELVKDIPDFRPDTPVNFRTF